MSIVFPFSGAARSFLDELTRTRKGISRVSALFEKIKTAGLEGPHGLTMEQTENRRQENIASLFERALSESKSTNQVDVWQSIQEQLRDVSSKGSNFHDYGEITENDVIGYWESLPDKTKEELGLKEATIMTKPIIVKPELVGV